MQQIKRDIEVPRVGLESGVQQSYYDFILSRIQKKKKDFEKIFKEDTIENRYSGFFCLLALAHDPNEKKIKNAVKSIQKFVNEIEESELESPNSSPIGIISNEQQAHINKLNEEKRAYRLQNEKFFIDVFFALKLCKIPEILCQLVDVVNFYSNHESEYQSEFINSETILWLLRVIDDHLANKSKINRFLCCLCSLTLLGIVDKHNVEISYQEQEIIRKYNKILQNLDDPDEDEENNHEHGSSILEESDEGSGSYDYQKEKHRDHDHTVHEVDSNSGSSGSFEESDSPRVRVVAEQPNPNDSLMIS